MTHPPVDARARVGAGLFVAVLGLVGVLFAAVPASAASAPPPVTIEVAGLMGPAPSVAHVGRGGTVVFRNSALLGPRTVTSNAPWSFPDVTVNAGKSSDPIAVPTKSGSYAYTIKDGRTGTVVVDAASSPSPAPSATATGGGASSSPSSGPSAPATGKGGASSTASAKASKSSKDSAAASSVSPSPFAGGRGVTGFPQLSVGSLTGAPTAGATSGPAPDVAPLLPGQTPTAEQPLVTGGSDFTAAGQPSTAQLLGDRLPAGGSSRHLGLPGALAAVALAGVISLLVRTLLAESGAAQGS